MSKSLVDFYKENKISPVRQDISDLSAHFERRDSLYRLLGIVPSLLEGKNILEVGPGGGFNSIHTASLKPARYHLVEGNPTGVTHIKEQFSSFPEFNKNIEIFCCLLEEYKQDAIYDVVICEGVLSGVPKPKETLSLLKKFVKPGGVLIITCIDEISYFPDMLRRLVAQLTIGNVGTLEEQTSKLVPIFEKHFSNLPGMSRPVDDWIIDNVINPASIGPLLSIPSAISTLENEFDFYAASPDFQTDWRWYKQIIKSEKKFNERALEQYWANVHNFLDYTKTLASITIEENKKLFDLTVKFRSELRALEENGSIYSEKIISEIISSLNQIAKNTARFNHDTTLAINEVISWLEKKKDINSCSNFQKLFGRGQQYLSFIKI